MRHQLCRRRDQPLWRHDAPTDDPAASNQKGGQTRIDVLANLRKDLPGSKAKDTTQLSLTVVAFASCSCSKHPLLTVTPASSG